MVVLMPPKDRDCSLDMQNPSSSAEGWRALVLPGLGVLVGLAGLAMAYLVTDSAKGQFIVIGPPLGGFATTLEIVSKAEGAVIATGGLGNVLIAASDGADFSDRLWASGAWAVFPAPTALGCETPISEGPAV